jgi:TonB family protein
VEEGWYQALDERFVVRKQESKTLHDKTRWLAVTLAGLMAAAAPALLAQQGRWASENDATAKHMIEMERKWAESACTLQSVAEFIADDFQGTAPSGKRYDKKAAIQNDVARKERECRLDDAKVRFFGDSVALVYGSERATRKPENGPEKMRCLVWTDTWLKRRGKWQIVAAQDTDVPCKWPDSLGLRQVTSVIWAKSGPGRTITGVMNSSVRKFAFILTGAILVLQSAFVSADDSRKIVKQVAPVYSEIARRANITGTVKVEVTIAPNGAVTNTKLVGGHPLLAQSALEAVKNWKYEPAATESTTLVVFNFNR